MASLKVPVFRPVAELSANEVQGLVELIAARVGQVLERRGLIERDIENAWLSFGAEPGPLDGLLGQSITYRMGIGRINRITVEPVVHLITHPGSALSSNQRLDYTMDGRA